MNQPRRRPPLASLIAWPPLGRYVLAVSGGADSMTLLHVLAAAAPQRDYELVVAHFDHGLRLDSAADHDFVRAAADHYGLPFTAHAARLGTASEDAARQARHTWLAQTCRRHQAAAVITAHHQDDLIETSLLNLARGSGRRGLAPMQPTSPPAETPAPILRPLLAVSRAELRRYAAAHHLNWREDPTNADLTNPRNFLRHRLLAVATPDWRRRYLKLISQLAVLNPAIDTRLHQLLAPQNALPKIENNSQKFPMSPNQNGTSVKPTPPAGYTFPRALVQDLSLTELAELLAAAARQLSPGIELDRRLVQELTLFAKTAPPHRHRPLHQGLELSTHPHSLKLTITLKHHKIS